MASKNYEAIAAKKIRKPGDTPSHPRYLVYSRNKKGKTKFCSTAPNILILDPENGADWLKKRNPDIWPVESWDDIDEAYKFLKGGKHNFQWVAVDGTTRMSNMALRWVMGYEEERDLDRKPGMVQKRDYGRAGEMFKGMLLNFQTLPMGVIYTAQERIIEVGGTEDGDEEVDSSSHMYVPDLPNGARGSLNSIVDVIGRLYVVKATKRVRVNGTIEEREYPQRRLFLGEHVQYDTGGRSEYTLPDFLKDPTVDRLTKLISEGKAA
jgi:hypothetical protein